MMYTMSTESCIMIYTMSMVYNVYDIYDVCGIQYLWYTNVYGIHTSVMVSMAYNVSVGPMPSSTAISS